MIIPLKPMTHSSTLNEVVKTCSKCGVTLKHFIGYIPGLGEACMKCYVECAREKELKT